jgi:hypothetical protein
VTLANGVVAIKGEKKTETEDKDRLFSERYYGRFERRIPVEDVEEDKVSASFRNGVTAQAHVGHAEARPDQQYDPKPAWPLRCCNCNPGFIHCRAEQVALTGVCWTCLCGALRSKVACVSSPFHNYDLQC